MIARLMKTALVSAAVVLPSVAAFGQITSWYVVQNPSTKRCTIMEQKPVASEGVVVSPDGTVYKTRTEAEGAIKTIKVCSHN